MRKPGLTSFCMRLVWRFSFNWTFDSRRRIPKLMCATTVEYRISGRVTRYDTSSCLTCCCCCRWPSSMCSFVSVCVRRLCVCVDNSYWTYVVVSSELSDTKLARGWVESVSQRLASRWCCCCCCCFLLNEHVCECTLRLNMHTTADRKPMYTRTTETPNSAAETKRIHPHAQQPETPTTNKSTKTRFSLYYVFTVYTHFGRSADRQRASAIVWWSKRGNAYFVPRRTFAKHIVLREQYTQYDIRMRRQSDFCARVLCCARTQ